ncbi:MAG: histidine triad nucleotide-binding protein [Clostridia bacterium]|nr:histidine triad nucleotide-binding protein [Clostridia bacterium]
MSLKILVYVGRSGKDCALGLLEDYLMTDATCIFCKIIRGEIPSKTIYQDDDCIIIEDLHPIAKYHYLLIPKQHYPTIGQMNDEEAEMLMRSIRRIPELSELLHLENGYRLVINQGEDAGQTVLHLHIHILAGQPLDFKC